MDRDTEQGSEFGLKRSQSNVGRGGHVHDKIDVRARRILTARNRAEHPGGTDTVAPSTSDTASRCVRRETQPDEDRPVALPRHDRKGVGRCLKRFGELDSWANGVGSLKIRGCVTTRRKPERTGELTPSGSSAARAASNHRRNLS